MTNRTPPHHEPDGLRPKFELGQVVATPGALAALQRSGQSPNEFLARHALGDWGDELCEEDSKLNDHSLVHEENPELRTRILSAYKTKLGERIWIITEADRSSSCVLLPDEY